MIPLNDLIALMKQLTGQLNEANEQESKTPSKKEKKKSKAKEDILNSSLEAIEKTEDLQHAHASLKAVCTTFMSPAGQSLINSALVTVAAQLEGHLASGETDMTEQVRLASALEMAMAMAKKVEEQLKDAKDAKQKAAQKKPDPHDGLLYMALLLSSIPLSSPSPSMDLLLKILKVLNQELAKLGLPLATQNDVKKMMKEQVQQRQVNNQNQQNAPGHQLPAAFSTKIPKPGDP